MRKSFIAVTALFASFAFAKGKPEAQAPHISIHATVDKVRAGILAEFVPHNYSIDSDNASQLRLSRPMSMTEVLSWKSDHLILGNSIPECRRVHTLIFIPVEDATDVTMRWETVCPQSGGSDFRLDDHNKKELEFMQTELATLKGKIENTR